MEINQRFNLVKRNTTEIITEKELQDLLLQKKSPFAYYGAAPTGPFHMAYLVPLSKVFDFSQTGIKTKILIANIHAALDDLKAPWEEVDLRGKYYQKCIELSFPWEDNPKFYLGSDFQLSKEYILDTLKLSTLVTEKRATRAASEVTRMKNPKVSELIYPLMQSLDEEYLKTDIQLGGIDQRHIMALAREYLPKLDYSSRIEIMTPLIASLKGPGTKMSASEPMSHIKVYDTKELVKKKINQAYCPEGEINDNALLQLCRFVVFPVVKRLKIERPKKFGGDVEYNQFEKLQADFQQKNLHPADLKSSLAEALIKIFAKVRKYWQQHQQELKDLGENFL